MPNTLRKDDEGGEILILPNLGTADTVAADELRKKGIYYVTGEIDTGTLLDIQQDILLKHLDPAWTGDIQIIVNSVGGEAAEAWALIDLLDWVRMPVRTIGIGMCASAGACLLACGTLGKRVVTKNTTVMVHGASMGMAGNKQQLVASMEYVEQEHLRDVRFWSTHSKYTKQEDVVSMFLDGEDHYFTADEALKYGIVDEVIGSKPRKSKKSK